MSGQGLANAADALFAMTAMPTYFLSSYRLSLVSLILSVIEILGEATFTWKTISVL